MKIVIGTDQLGWHTRFSEAFNSLNEKSHIITVENLNTSDWMDKLNGCDLLIWKPFALSPEATSLIKEKFYFINNYLHIPTIPNFETIWHYDSKIAQSYLFKHFGVTSPDTFVSFDWKESESKILSSKYPLVIKKSWGAGSSNVKKINSAKNLKRVINNIFFQEFWNWASKHKKNNFIGFMNFINEVQPILPTKLCNYLLGKDFSHKKFGSIYLQEFVPGNMGDFRVTVIGNKYVYAMWRENRKNDFRASGSGKIKYNKNIPIEVLQYCLEINNLCNFDSMAYDLLFDNGRYLITEISFAYSDIALFNSPGYFETTDTSLTYIEGNTWPEELWVRWAIQKYD